jgi:Sterol desaturase
MLYISLEKMTEFDIYTYGVPIVLLLIAAEVIYSTVNGLGLYKFRDTLAGLGLLIGNFMVGLLTKSSIFFLYVYLYQFKFITVNEVLPTWAVWIVTFVMIDFVYYWYHRFSHRVRFMWAVHMNHHSSEEMNFTVSLRQAWFGPITKVPFFIVMPLIGFDPIITAVAGVASTLWGVIGHTQWIRRLGVLEYILVTPSSHRVHHGSNECYIDKNYGNLLIVWDRLFGTFAEEIEPVRFGIRENVKTFNPIKITFMFWQQMVSDFKNSKNQKERFLSFFGKPEWKP